MTYFISPFEKNYVYLYASFTHKTSHAMKRLIIILTLALCVWTIDAVAQTLSKDNDNTTSATLSPDKEPRIDGSRPPRQRQGCQGRLRSHPPKI